MYSKKSDALKKVKPGEIVGVYDIKSYFITESHKSFLDLILKSEKPCYYEFILKSQPVIFFADIDIKHNHELFEHNVSEIIDIVKSTLSECLLKVDEYFMFDFIILESHGLEKKSFHVLIRIKKGVKEYVFENVESLKMFMIKDVIPKFENNYNIDITPIIDTSVYREGLFRTIYSTKKDENRPLIKSIYSDDFENISSFVTFIPENSCILKLNSDVDIVEEIGVGTRIMDVGGGETTSEITADDITEIRKFTRKCYKYKKNDIREIKVDVKLDCIIVALNDKYCENVEREHKSNYQYIVFNSSGSRLKCHDPDCVKYKSNEILLENMNDNMRDLLLKYLEFDKTELELLENATTECKEYIKSNFDEKINEIEFDKELMLFKSDASEESSIRLNGKCRKCLEEHHISSDGYCIKCKVCATVFPPHTFIPVKSVKNNYQILNTFWNFIQNNTVIINNHYTNEEDILNCDINLDNAIFKNKKVTKLVNQILDGHKVSKISLLLKTQYDDIVFDTEYFYFKNNIWKLDRQNLFFTEEILNLEKLFSKVQNFYLEKEITDESTKLVKNIKCLINKLNGFKFKDEIVKESRRYFYEENFKYKLNSFKYLIPFFNGVYDLNKNEFRDAKRNDYINLTVNYKYSPEKRNPKVMKFVNQVLPNENVRDYVLKEFSKCLNGDIPNTKFLIFIGNGANGKSQLLNLMKITMGEFGEKMESTLLTRKRSNPNETSTEKLKLLNKRFAFLSEPEDGEKFNIGLLKELTGSEEIVARGLYSAPVSFIMEVKLFLACNELPEVKGEDTAIWRRISVIDFPSKFVHNPTEDNEYPLDATIPLLMREDITWRETFMNILIEYYYKDIPEPKEVQTSTNQYRDENNEVFAWCEENIEYNEDSVLKLPDLCRKYFENKPRNDARSKGKFRKTFEDYVKILKKKHPLLHTEMKNSSHMGTSYKGWKFLSFKNQDLF
jgi:P4 family phage/plasmid primase-like protien